MRTLIKVKVKFEKKGEREREETDGIIVIKNGNDNRVFDVSSTAARRRPNAAFTVRRIASDGSHTRSTRKTVCARAESRSAVARRVPLARGAREFYRFRDTTHHSRQRNTGVAMHWWRSRLLRYHCLTYM